MGVNGGTLGRGGTKRSPPDAVSIQKAAARPRSLKSFQEAWPSWEEVRRRKGVAGVSHQIGDSEGPRREGAPEDPHMSSEENSGNPCGTFARVPL